jgi:hypothetical protein
MVGDPASDQNQGEAAVPDKVALHDRAPMHGPGSRRSGESQIVPIRQRSHVAPNPPERLYWWTTAGRSCRSSEEAHSTPGTGTGSRRSGPCEPYDQLNPGSSSRGAISSCGRVDQQELSVPISGEEKPPATEAAGEVTAQGSGEVEHAEGSAFAAEEMKKRSAEKWRRWLIDAGVNIRPTSRPAGHPGSPSKHQPGHG